MLNFSSDPYNDDYNESKKFYKILYRPSYAVQARELTQMQTMLQTQIARHGSAIFQQGAMVIPGQAAVQTENSPNGGVDYVKLVGIYSGSVVETYLQNLVGTTLIGTSGVVAKVSAVASAEGSDASTLFLTYTTAGTDGVTKTFSAGEVITTSDSVHTMQVASGVDAIGKGSTASIQEGVYYINGHFCLVESQTLVLDKYSATPSYRVGLVINEQIVTPEEDETLLDNAQNSYNYAAPGAHRHYIELVLGKLALTDTADTNFVELIRVTDGVIKTIVNNTQYSQLGDTLARRTYDESGDYTVRGFEIDVREHRNNDRGEWTANTPYLIGDIVKHNGYIYTALNSATSITTAPSFLSGTGYDGSGATGVNWQFETNPAYNRGVYLNGNESQLAIGIEAGKGYIRGYEIEKTAVTYIPVNKARDFTQVNAAVIPATIGNYVLVTNVNNAPPMETLDTVLLQQQITDGSYKGTAQGTTVGTARVRFMEWHTGLPYSSTSVYKLSLFDVQMNAGYDFNSDVKSIAYTTPGDTNLNFSADISPITTPLIGSISSSASAVTGVGTSFLTDLAVNDLILIGGSTGVYRRVTAIASQTALTIDSNLTITGASYALCTTQILEPNAISSVFPLSNYAVRSMRQAGTGGINNNTYTCYQKFTQTASSTTLTLSTTGTFSSAADSTHYYCVDNDAGSGGAVFTPVSITPSGSTVTIVIPGGLTGHSIDVIATVIRNGSGFEKTKTLTNTSEVFINAVDVQAATIYLDKADLYKVSAVLMAPTVAFGSTPLSTDYTVDITDRFIIDSGQRASHYDWASLSLSPSFVAPSNPIKVVYSYFEHGAGDYFDVNSYASIDYKKIQPALRDSIDFRPRVANKSSGATKTFTGTGGSITAPVKRGESITADYSYYLGRKDKIAIDYNGLIFDVAGIPATNSGFPADPSLGMVLYMLDIEPYTFGTKTTSVLVKKVDNKRYTMRDIGKLETRINNIEYYTALSLLEQETQALKLPDASGLDRMKNGFVVDNFSGNQLGDARSPDYFCSIDMEANQLRPFYTAQNVNLLEKFSNDIARSAANYQLTGDVVTLPYTNTPMIVQGYASRTENINPFAIFTFLGEVQITPPTDDWFEVNRLPDIIQQVEGNYNTISQLAAKAGILGTVWNAWQTTWTGSSTTSYATYSEDWRWDPAGSEWLDATFGHTNFSSGWAHRVLTAQTTSTTLGQSRNGVNTSVALKTDYQQVNDATVSTAIIPYIRSRNILVQANKLKPNSRFYAFFDGVDVSAYCTPAATLVYTPIAGAFDSKSNVGGLGSEAKRRINGDSQVCLNAGDVITNASNTASAVVVDVRTGSSGEHILSLANVIGTFAYNDSIVGSISSATGTVVSITKPTTLVTSWSGSLQFIFNIPQTDSIRFRAGTRELKLLDVNAYAGDYTSRGVANYEATGILQTKQATVNAVRNGVLVQNQVSDNRTIVDTVNRAISDTGWYDPLAQSFMVQQKGGAFLTSIDVFFASKDAALPVTLQVREMVNGTPGKTILPFSVVTKPAADVNISTNFVTLPDGSIKHSYDTATTFTFESPVYVQDNTEYCFVLQSDSNAYNVWISYMGDSVPGANRTISEQPYAGVMFKSQNASTWTPDNNADIKFTINRAKFDVNAVSAIELINDVLPYSVIETDPFETKTGVASVRVWQYDHGMPTGSTVSIDAGLVMTGATGTITATTSAATVVGVGTAFTTDLGVGSNLYTSAGVFLGTVLSITDNTHLTMTANGTVAVTAGAFMKVLAVHGIPANQIYGTHVISNVDANSYTFTTSTTATSSGYGGGDNVRASKNVQYDLLLPTLQMQNFSDTKSSMSMKTTSGKAVDGTQTAYVIDSTYAPCLIGQNNAFLTPRMIASEINENTSMSGNKSINLVVQMSTQNDSLSPVLDTTRTSLIAISNKLNAPTEANTNVSSFDTITSFVGSTGVFTFGNNTTGTISSTVSAIRTAMANIAVGKFITISGATTSANNGTFLVTGFVDNGTTATLSIGTTFTAENSISGTTVSSRTLFADEIAPKGSSSVSKYVTTPVKFGNVSTYLRCMIAANVPSEANVAVYYKTCLGDNSKLDTTKYTLATADNGLIKVSNGDKTFSDSTYTITGLPAFDTAVVKLVFTSTNSSAVPVVRDFRVIACP